MHTTIFTTIVSLFFPLLATAVWQPPTWPPQYSSSYFFGDMLNITRCYCEDDMSYYQFDYRNFHNAQVYSVGWTCFSEGITRGRNTRGSKRVEFLLKKCYNEHDSWRKDKVKGCSKSYNGDKFCFELGNEKDPYDYYYLNKHKRPLPDYGIREFLPVQCTALCRELGMGRAVASDTEGGWEKSLPDLLNAQMTLRSSFRSYSDLADISFDDDN